MTFEQKIRHELEQAQESGEVIQIHREHDSFEVGTITCVTRENVSFLPVGSKGRLDGYRILPIEDIVRLSYDSLYLRGLLTLRDNINLYRPLAPDIVAAMGGDMSEALDVAREHRIPVSIQVPDETLQGYIKEVGEGWFRLLIVDEDTGMDDGTTIVEINDVRKLFFNGPNEFKFDILHRTRYGIGPLG